MKSYFVYILTNESGTLYIGITNDLDRRVQEHQLKLVEGFASKYNLNKLVWFEEFNDVNDAILREKQLKGWRRSKKMALIMKFNPNFEELRVEFSREPSTSSG
jgi:putative endonuclease